MFAVTPSENLYPDFIAQEALVFPDPPFVPGLGSANVRSYPRGAFREEGQAATAHEQPANIIWQSCSIRPYGHASHQTQPSNAVDAPTTSGQASPAHVWSSSAIPYMHNWNYDLVHSPSKLQSPSVSPYIQPPFAIFDTDDTIGNHEASCQQQLHPHNTTSHHRTNSPSPSISQRSQTVKSTQKSSSKQHQCSHCTLAFARLPDLKRHLDSVHLGIRHHCHEPRCQDNHGKGYCRSEKLRKHAREVHGHA